MNFILFIKSSIVEDPYNRMYKSYIIIFISIFHEMNSFQKAKPRSHVINRGESGGIYFITHSGGLEPTTYRLTADCSTIEL